MLIKVSEAHFACESTWITSSGVVELVQSKKMLRGTASGLLP